MISFPVWFWVFLKVQILKCYLKIWSSSSLSRVSAYQTSFMEHCHCRQSVCSPHPRGRKRVHPSTVCKQWSVSFQYTLTSPTSLLILSANKNLIFLCTRAIRQQMCHLKINRYTSFGFKSLVNFFSIEMYTFFVYMFT